ncbi:MAG: phosphoheptose isomerase [Synoicihabitans sp.]
MAPCAESISTAYHELEACFIRGGRLYLCGNGGSAADAEHIAGELLKGFVLPRPSDRNSEHDTDPALDRLQEGLPAIPLSGFPALRSAVANDTNPELEYAQLVWALARPEDMVLGISCSGNAGNVLLALQAARRRGARTLLLTGAKPGKCAPFADVSIHAPDTEVYRIQELHLPIYHCLCLALEAHFFGTNAE